MIAKKFALAAILAFFAYGSVMAQPKVVRIVVPYPPGGSPDSTARVIGDKIQQGGKYTIVIDNKPGASGAIAADAVKNAQPDGLTLLMGDSSTYSIAPNVKKKISYDVLKDFKPVGLAATSPIYLIDQPGAGATVKELIATLKAKPGQMYGSSGYGTAHHLAMEMFKSMAGVEMGHVPYKGASQTAPAVAAGDVVATFAGYTIAKAFAQGGKIRILAIAEPKRSAMSPEIPTIAESGVPGFGFTISLGFLTAANSPDSVIKDLNEEITKAAKDPEVKRRLNGLGVEPAYSTPAEFGQQIVEELASYGKIVKAANVTED